MQDKKLGVLNQSVRNLSKDDQASIIYHNDFQRKGFSRYEIALLAKRLGKAKPEGKGWRALCPAHEDNNPSLSLSCDERTQKLLAKCWAGCSFESIILALKDRGLLQGTSRYLNSSENNRFIHVNKQISDKSKNAAKLMWQKAHPIDGTLAERYLQKARQINFIPSYARTELRFSNLPYNNGETKVIYPCLLVRISDFEGQFLGIQRIYISSDGTSKAPVEQPKKNLGYVSGGGAFISRIPHGPLFIVEGVEDALTILMSEPNFAVCAALGANMSNLSIPIGFHNKIFIGRDEDEAGKYHAETLARKLVREGHHVHIFAPHGAKDFNDMLIKQGGANR